MMKSKLHATRIDLSVDVREKLTLLLNQQIFDTFQLYILTKQAHRRISGPLFLQLHGFSETFAEQIEDQLIGLTDRGDALEGVARGYERLTSTTSLLAEYLIGLTASQQHLNALVAGINALAASTRLAIDCSTTLGDGETADLLTDVSRTLENARWILEGEIRE